MKSQSPSRLPGLDTLRTIAIVSVVIYHLQPVLPPALSIFGRFGWMGVDLFFVLSGFLIASQLFKPCKDGRPINVLDFYRRRAYRILPAYLTVVALYLFVPAWREQPILTPAWKLLTFTYNLLMHYPAERAFSHSWSLCIEEQFYLVLPIIILLLLRKPSARATIITFATVLLFGIGIRWFELTHVVNAPGAGDESWALFMKRIYYSTYSRLDGLLCGVALATIRSFRPTWWSPIEERGTVTSLIGSAFIAAAFWTLHFDYPSPDQPAGVLFGFPLLSAGFALWVASAIAKNGPLKTRVPGTQIIATLAFSLYLTHKAVAHVAPQLIPWLRDNNTWLAAALYAAVCVVCAALLYRCVEMPFLQLRDRQTGKISAAAIATQASLDPGI